MVTWMQMKHLPLATTLDLWVLYTKQNESELAKIRVESFSKAYKWSAAVSGSHGNQRMGLAVMEEFSLHYPEEIW